MAYQYKNSKGQTYYLHSKDVTLRGSGVRQRIYFFARQTGEGAMEDMPQGYTIAENTRTGLPVLKKSPLKYRIRRSSSSEKVNG